MRGSLPAKEVPATHEGRNIADTSIIEEPQNLRLLRQIAIAPTILEEHDSFRSQVVHRETQRRSTGNASRYSNGGTSNDFPVAGVMRYTNLDKRSLILVRRTNPGLQELLRQSYLLFSGSCHCVVFASIAVLQSTKPIEKLGEVFVFLRLVKCTRDNSVSPLPFEEPDTQEK